jgi:hypothetical protein
MIFCLYADESLTLIKHCVHLAHVGFVIDYPAFNLYPRVRFEGHLLRSDDHLCGYAMTSQQAGRCCGSLQTEHLFPVPNARHVYGSADLLGRVDGCGVPADPGIADLLVESREVPSR